MKSIRIIKQKQSEDASETRTGGKKPDEPNTRKIVNTVKTWIEESQQRRRNLPRSLSALGVLMLIGFAIAIAQSPATNPTSDHPLTPEERAIKVNIATTD